MLLIHRVADAAAAEAIAQDILATIKPRFCIQQRDIFITASIGIVLSQRLAYHAPEHMLRDADTAMYNAKHQGKACYSFFTPAMQQASAQILQIETELHRAVKQRELIPYYQPIVELSSHAILGLEVLCRWQHPERGLLMPDCFIPVAEETELIVALGYHLLDEACAQLQQWQTQHLVDDQFYVSLNVAARQLAQPCFPQHVMNCLAQYGLQPHQLHLEITESCILDNMVAGDVLAQLQQQGVCLSVDDFGTGYSSLSYLHNLPVSTLKIDRAFIQNCNHNARDAGIVAAIMGVAQALNLDVISEGIDVPEQIDHLLDVNCHLGQGYLFSKPLHAHKISLLLADHAAAEASRRSRQPRYSQVSGVRV